MNQIIDNDLFEAFANASDNIFIYATDCKTNLTRISKKAVSFFGFESEYIHNFSELWIDYVHPEDRNIYTDDISAVHNGTSMYHNCQYRVRNRYGKYVWIECRGSVIKDSTGNPDIFAGIMTRLDNQTKYDNLTHLLTGYELLRNPFNETGALMLIGIDNLRTINSRYGLLFGNKVISRLADILTKEATNAIVYRFQGDEFAVYGKGMTVDEMSEIFKKVFIACGEEDPDTKSVKFSISAGILAFTETDYTPDILSKAELSLAFAKDNSSSHMTIYSAEIEAKQNRKNKVSEELLNCIKNDFRGFYVVYQPILDSLGKTVVACETLLRWKTDNEEIGACYPDEFISILESNGGINDIGYFVMREAIKQAALWQKQFKKFNVSFNVSYMQLEDPKFVPAIIEAVEKYNVDASCIVVELTESIFVADTVMVKNSFELLRKHGIKIALDDFGTGNSSFWMLHNIDVDIIKLDQSFIRGLDKSTNKIDFAIVESVCLMCKRIGCLTIAEGVETEDIQNMINKFGFAGLQGYLFSRPVEVPDFEKFLYSHDMK